MAAVNSSTMHLSSPPPTTSAQSSDERGRVPLYSSGTLDSARPTTTTSTSSSESPKSSLAASPRYIKQFQKLLEHQRQVFDEERSLWDLERADLHQRISQLEMVLAQHGLPVKALGSTPGHHFRPSDRHMTSWSTASTNGSRESSESAVSEQVWKGSQPPVQPARTFSEPSTHRSSEKLPSISEDVRPRDVKRISFSDHDAVVTSPAINTLHKPSIHGSLLSRNLDGINFKTAGLPAAVVQQVLKSSPDLQSPTSDSNVSPNTAISPPDGQLALPKGIDPYTKDAGHTPLARLSKFASLDGSARSTNANSTPPQVESQFQVPEPYPPTVKPPTERHDSYFPMADAKEDVNAESETEAQGGEKPIIRVEEDPTLKGPLGLTNETPGDVKFLSDLDRKLSDVVAAASESHTLSPESEDRQFRDQKTQKENQPVKGEVQARTGGVNDKGPHPGAPSTPPLQKAEDDESGEGKRCKTPESEPRLRMKRSTNFGSAFGEGTVGRGF